MTLLARAHRTLPSRGPRILFALLALGGILLARGVEGQTTPASGFFTTEQATEGRRIYEGECTLCHAPREFSGSVFQRRWLTPPVSGIFVHILNTMPQDAPGSLKPEQVSAIVAYLLQMNGQPAGPRPLPTSVEALAQIRVPVSPAPTGSR
jgi:S-disulfanyl-L-cysteine oxidoreductase SoxD